MQITKETFSSGCRVLIDNGIDIDEAQIVLQALCYVMFDEETEQHMNNKTRCCQNCVELQFGGMCKGTYDCCNIHSLDNWKAAPTKSIV